MEVGPENAPDLLAGLGMLAIAALLLWVAPTDRVHRAFALLQVVNGGLSLTFAGAIGWAHADAVTAVALSEVNGYLALALPFATAFFTLRFLDPRGRSRGSRLLAWGLLVGVAGVLAAYVLDHAIVATSRGDGATVLGPLGFVWYSLPSVFGSMAFVFATGARRVDPAPRREGLVLASLSFSLIAIYWSVFHLLVPRLAPDHEFSMSRLVGDPAPLLVAQSMPWLGAILVLATVVAVVAASGVGSASDRWVLRSFAVGATASAFVGLCMVGLVRLDPLAYATVPYTLDGVLRVVSMGLLAYALLRRQVFDTQVRLRFAISRTSVAAAFVAVFFVVSEAAQQFFGETLGSSYVGILAAGALVFAIAPLSRAADLIAEKAVPVTPADDAVDAGERATLYRRQVTAAYADGKVSPDERRMLAVAADSLGLTAKEALEIELDVVGTREVERQD